LCAFSRQSWSISLTDRQLDLDVEVSGSESADEPSSDAEFDSDRVFANNFKPTQAPKGYNQRAIYLAGLSTQAAPKAGLAFKQRVDRDAFLAKARRPVLISDDEGDGEEIENEYQLGSFVCNDEDVAFDSDFNAASRGLRADVCFAAQSEPMSCS